MKRDLKSTNKTLFLSFTAARAHLLDLCDRVERGESVTKNELYFYNSLVFFQMQGDNVEAVDEFLKVVRAAGLI